MQRLSRVTARHSLLQVTHIHRTLLPAREQRGVAASAATSSSSISSGAEAGSSAERFLEGEPGSSTADSATSTLLLLLQCLTIGGRAFMWFFSSRSWEESPMSNGHAVEANPPINLALPSPFARTLIVLVWKGSQRFEKRNDGREKHRANNNFSAWKSLVHRKNAFVLSN